MVIFLQCKCFRGKLKIVLYKDLPEWDSGLINKEAWMASARMSAKCTRSTVLGIESTFLGIQSTFFRDLVNLFRKAILIKRTFSHGELSRSSVGVLSVVGRWNRGRYKRSKRDGNLNKSTFLSLVVLRSFLGSSLVHPWLLTWEQQGSNERGKS